MTEPVGETPVSQDIPKEEKESLETVSKETVTPPVHREQDVRHEQKLPTPVVLKTPHQNPEPVRPPEDIQRRNIPRFVRH